MSVITPKQNAFKFKIAPHKQKSIVKKKIGRKMSPLANGALCSKHNGKSGTGANRGIGRFGLLFMSLRWIFAYVVQF
jgi:hypothetical protein